MKIDVIKIAQVVIPLLVCLVNRKVPKAKTNLYLEASKKCDLVLDSLQELAIKYKTGVGENKELDAQNIQTGVDIAEKTLEAYKERLEIIKRISGLYE